MKRLAIITMAAVLMQAVVHAELSASKPVRKPGQPDGTAISVDLEDSLISRRSRFDDVELPSAASGLAASMPAAKLRARWTRPVDLSRSVETEDLSQAFRFGGGAVLYLLALALILYARNGRHRGTCPRVLLARPTPFPGVRPLSTPKK